MGERSTRSDVRVRPLEAIDRAAWLALWRAYQGFYRTSVPERATALAWQRLLDGDEPMTGFIALSGAAGVGLAHVVRHRSFWTEGDYAYLQDLFVAPSARTRGVGSALIAAARRHAAACGCDRLYWLTEESNAAARHLYDRVATCTGYVEYRQPLPGTPS
jgi:GNAT superfamily N-acetyltransferase